jgi:hypothetical protein
MFLILVLKLRSRLLILPTNILKHTLLVLILALSSQLLSYRILCLRLTTLNRLKHLVISLTLFIAK